VLGAGDYVEAFLSIFGITKERMSALNGKSGRCNKCNQRQERLNQIGKKVLWFLRGESTTPSDPPDHGNGM
jgi:hypothetical protein